MANGNVVESLETISKTQTAREFAAEIDRSHPAVSRVQTCILHDVTVWLSSNPGEYGAGFEPPKGWDIKQTFVSSDGTVTLDLDRAYYERMGGQE